MQLQTPSAVLYLISVLSILVSAANVNANIDLSDSHFLWNNYIQPEINLLVQTTTRIEMCTKHNRVFGPAEAKAAVSQSNVDNFWHFYLRFVQYRYIIIYNKYATTSTTLVPRVHIPYSILL